MINHSKRDFGGVTSFEVLLWSLLFCHTWSGGIKKCRKSGERRVILSQGGRSTGPCSVVPQSSEACIFKNIEAESPPHVPNSQIHQSGLCFCPLEMSPVSGRLGVLPAQLEEALCSVPGHSWAPGWRLLLPVVRGLSEVPGRETADGIYRAWQDHSPRLRMGPDHLRWVFWGLLAGRGLLAFVILAHPWVSLQNVTRGMRGGALQASALDFSPVLALRGHSVLGLCLQEGSLFCAWVQEAVNHRLARASVFATAGFSLA